ncbi:MAG: sugar ABC transporter permease [Proteobacteria bacterium]|nr:sugar ABC transporter permease [Pseudomonadota bacterium]
MPLPTETVRKRRGVHGRDWVGYVFVAFFTVPFLLFNVLPILFGAYVAFTEWGIFGDPSWVGLENFRTALADEWVATAFMNVLKYALVVVPGVTILGLLAALFVNQGWPLAGLARTLFFAPNVCSATVIGIVWVWVLDTQYGLLNQYLSLFGLAKVSWLTSTRWSLVGVSMASIWWDLGLAFVLFLAALQDLPRELSESASVDGANPLQQFLYVTLPQLRPVLSLVVTLQLIATLRIFSQVYVMTNGGPAGSSSSVIHYVYTTAIVRHLMGYSAAVSMLLFSVIVVATAIQRFLLKERGAWAR